MHLFLGEKIKEATNNKKKEKRMLLT